MERKEGLEVIETPFSHGKFDFKARRVLGKSLRSGAYNQAYILPNSWKSALVPFFAKIPRRVGWLGESRYFLLSDVRKLNKAEYPLMVQRFVALCFTAGKRWNKDRIPVPRLQVDAGNQERLRQQFKLSNNQPTLLLCPGAAYGPAKQWPSDGWVKVAKNAINDGCNVWLMGAKPDQLICDTINKRTNNQCINLCGQTSLLDAIDITGLADIVISNDSGAMHIAAALAKPQIAIFGSSSPEFTPPLNDKAQVISLDHLACKPCFKRTCPLEHMQCLKAISAEQVIGKIQKIINR